MAGMSDHLHALAEATGWTSLATADASGVYRVALENNLDAAFVCLGEQFCLMRGVVVDLPMQESERTALCEQAARLQVAVLRERPSILALEEPGQMSLPGETIDTARLICYRSVPLSVDAGTFLEEVQGWLNDYAWWKSNLAATQAPGSGMNTFFSNGLFAGLKL